MHSAHSTQLENTNNGFSLIWQPLLDELRKAFGEATFRSWFSHFELGEINNGVMIITVPTKFIKEWIINNYFNNIKEIVSKLDKSVTHLEIKTRLPSNRLIATSKPVDNDNITRLTVKEDKSDIFNFNLNSHFTFKNIVVGNYNKVAFESAKSLAENKDLNGNNILFIQSSFGMGKTHLLQAIAAHIKATDPNKKVAYLSAEKFMYLFIRSIKNNDLITFKENFREADVLLIDDLQFICGKNSTEQELINTVTALTESSKKVAIACDTSPYNLNIDVRAKSRLTGGLVVQINNPAYELRLEILRSKAEQLSTVINDSILELIALNITSSIRELEGALNKLVSYCTITGQDISQELAEEILHDNIAAHSQPISVDTILQYVAESYGVKVSDVQSNKRPARLVLARQIAAYVAKQMTQTSLQEIGHKLGNKDHTTVIYSIKKVEEKMNYDVALANNISKIIASLKTANGN